MKADLFTILPGIAIETEGYDMGEKVRHPAFLDDIEFRNARVLSYKKLQSNPKILTNKQWEYINEVHPKIIDANGNALADYLIIIDKNIEIKSLKPQNSDLQQIVTYFSCLQNLDSWVNLDFIKIMCPVRLGRQIFLNNSKEIHFNHKYCFVLPIEQDARAKLILNKNNEDKIIGIFFLLSKKNKNVYHRLINAITLFNESCRIRSFNPNSSIVLILSAFEGLLNIPRFHKSNNFVYAIKSLWGFNERIAQWADDLYTLRCKIVHGEFTRQEELLLFNDQYYTHFDIAREVFKESFYFVLEGYCFADIRTRNKYQTICKIENKIISNKEKINNILAERKKYTYSAFKSKIKLYEEFIKKVESINSSDLSTQEQRKKLLHITYNIAKEWTDDEAKKTAETKDKRIEEQIKMRIECLENILDALYRIFNTKDPLFWMHEQIHELQNMIRKVDPFIHRSNQFEFKLTEFLDRSIRGICNF